MPPTITTTTTAPLQPPHPPNLSLPSTLLSFISLMLTTVALFFNLISGWSLLEPAGLPLIFFCTVYGHSWLVFRGEDLWEAGVRARRVEGRRVRRGGRRERIMPSPPESSSSAVVTVSFNSGGNEGSISIGSVSVPMGSATTNTSNTSFSPSQPLPPPHPQSNCSQITKLICTTYATKLINVPTSIRLYFERTTSHPNLLAIIILSPLITIYHVFSLFMLPFVQSAPPLFRITPLWFFIRVTVLPGDAEEFWKEGSLSFFGIICLAFSVNMVLFGVMTYQGLKAWKFRDHTSSSSSLHMRVGVVGLDMVYESPSNRAGRFFDRCELVGMMSYVDNLNASQAQTQTSGSTDDFSDSFGSFDSSTGSAESDMDENAIIEDYIKHLNEKLELINSTCPPLKDPPLRPSLCSHGHDHEHDSTKSSSLKDDDASCPLECSICFERLLPQQTARTTCSCKIKNLYHTACILKWKKLRMVRSNNRGPTIASATTSASSSASDIGSIAAAGATTNPAAVYGIDRSYVIAQTTHKNKCPFCREEIWEEGEVREEVFRVRERMEEGVACV